MSHTEVDFRLPFIGVLKQAVRVMMVSSLAPLSTPSWDHALRVTARLIWVDAKQGLRKHLAGNTPRDQMLRAGGVIFGLLFMGALHVGAFALVSYTWLSPSTDKIALMTGLSTSIWAFLLFVMFSGGLVRALVVLHEQDDSSLLLCSPVSPRAILAGRLFGNALQSCLVDGFIVVPYINVRIFTFGLHLNFLWGYAVWFALAVMVTCVDGLFSFGMIRWFGLRQARFLAQAVPFLLIFGVTFLAGMLSYSIAQISPDQAHMPPEMQEHFIALSRTPLVWLAWAGAGRAVYLVMIFSAAAALALITLRLTERAFIEGSQNVSENQGSTRPGSADGPFRSSLLFLEVRKNQRLVARTPMMTVQCLAQALMPVGIACVLGKDDPSRAVAFFVIFASGVLSGMFTIAAGACEECEDLLAMAPRPLRLFRYGKMMSGFLFPVGFALLVGVALLLAGEGEYAAAVLLGGVPLGLASSLCGETCASPARPGTKPKLFADPMMMIPLLAMQIVSGAVAGGCVFAASYSNDLLALALLLSYLVMLLAISIAQLRKPLF